MKGSKNFHMNLDHDTFDEGFDGIRGEVIPNQGYDTLSDRFNSIGIRGMKGSMKGSKNFHMNLDHDTFDQVCDPTLIRFMDEVIPNQGYDTLSDRFNFIRFRSMRGSMKGSKFFHMNLDHDTFNEGFTKPSNTLFD